MKHFQLFLIITSLGFLTSCDAVNHLFYDIKNKTNTTVDLFIPYFISDFSRGESSDRVDTVIRIAPNQRLAISMSMMDIGFPWSTKEIYKESPGVCGLEILQPDTIIPIDCTKKEWKYWRGTSTLKIKRIE